MRSRLPLRSTNTLAVLFLATFFTTASFTATTLWAKPGVIKTTAGQSYDGEITDQGDVYVITVGKIDNRIPKSDVASVQYHGSIDDQYKEKLKALDAKDANGRVAVARFAFDNTRYDLAIDALNSALQIDPNNTAAMQMLKTVRAQQALEQQRTTPSTTPPPLTPTVTHAPATTTPAEALVPVEKKLLTPADINSIRQREIRQGEVVPMQIPLDAKKNFATQAGIKPSEFNNLPAAEQLRLILEKGDPETRAAVKIMKDPQALTDFKRLVQPMVLRNCATSTCHGGSNGGKLILYNGGDDATTYTNFYILEQFSQKAPGNAKSFFGGGAEQKLIQRGGGEKSLLIQYALPPSMADVPHPPVPNSGYNGVFRGKTDRLYGDIIEWMNKGITLVEPAYDIKYTPPMGKVSTPAATTAPAK